MWDLRPYLRRPISTLASIASDPMEAWFRLREQYAASRERPPSPELYAVEPNWESLLGEWLGLSNADVVTEEFWSLWAQVLGDLDAKGIQAGPLGFKGWNDGDPGFVRALWLLVRHLRPTNVVETGVAHGVTSRFILEALERNGEGRLCSIDRPPLEREWQEQVGFAVDPRLRHGWSYIRGSSRQRLPGLLAQLVGIDIFVHDSLHSERNVRFEIDSAWPFLRPGGVIVVDDIDVNNGFRSFTQNFPNHHTIVCEAEPVRPDPRRFNKKGLFGIIIKS
jgi:hypothetical protein